VVHAPAPELRDLAHEMAAAAAATDSGAFLIGVVGSVAVGKSTFAAHLADALGTVTVPRARPDDALVAQLRRCTVEVVSTDAFLLPNSVLEPLGGAMIKGTPQSYDWAALDHFLSAAAGGSAELRLPVYSHEIFDVVPGEMQALSTPDVLVVEGLNLLQRPPDAAIDVSRHLHRSIYLHAPAPVIEEWFVERFMALTRHAAETPGDFYSIFVGLDEDEVEAVAVWTWSEINAPNLHRYIEPTRARADLVVHHGADHSIVRIERQHGVDLPH